MFNYLSFSSSLLTYIILESVKTQPNSEYQLTYGIV